MITKLKLVEEATEEDEFQTLQRALIGHKQALEAVKWAEQDLQPLRRRYADARGERLLPSLERLKREHGVCDPHLPR